jgi:hypothetical protein
MNSWNLTFSAVWRVGVLAVLAWVIGGAFDGSSPLALFAVPLLVGAWMYAIFAVDRWVGTSANRPSPRTAPIRQ